MTIIERIYARGHENILCTHKTTIEITKDARMTKKGDCILGINASKACYDLSPLIKKQIQSGKKFKILLKVENIQDFFYGFGNKDLRLLDRKNMVFRKSDFICDRTVLINCSKSSKELKRELIDLLHQPETKLLITFEMNEG
ncbi:MAG: DUF371 domain-containing protein [Promethearchaeota archaeon]|jgi:hypothetical protein